MAVGLAVVAVSTTNLGVAAVEQRPLAQPERPLSPPGECRTLRLAHLGTGYPVVEVAVLSVRLDLPASTAVVLAVVQV